MTLTVGVVRETQDGERRVALMPDGVTRLLALGLDVVVETGAGAQAWASDGDYVKAGTRIASAADLYARSDVIVCLHLPDVAAPGKWRPGQVLIGLLQPLVNPTMAVAMARDKVTSLSLDGLPRTLSNAQSMDALTSQANVMGYKAAIVAADAYGSYLPMLMTAAGTVRPAKVLVIGAGVAGLQAIGTARRLGAVVTGYDVRDAARGDVLSTGASFLDLGSSKTADAAGSGGRGGYARELSPSERDAQQAAVVAAAATFDIIITTAQVPGRRPPLLISSAAIDGMRAGSVIVDLAASDLGGNVEGSRPEATVTSHNGIAIIGAGNLAATMPVAASTAYSRNIAALLAHLVHDGELVLDPGDEITAGVLITHDGEVVHPGVLAALTRIPPKTPQKVSP